MVEMMKEKILTGYCGLYCGDCIRYKCRASDLADELLNEIDKNHFAEYANVKKIHTKEFENFELFCATVKAISEINCENPCGSDGDGCGGTCKIIECVKNKSLEGCWECENFEGCDKFDFLKSFHGEATLKNLRKIKELGINNWAKAREKCYPWL
ncbi:MAG: DUF3795 domain-containing protein [Pseudomonadota bacterium]